MSESSQPNPLATDAAQADEPSGFPSVRAQTIVGSGVLLVAAGLAFGALQIPSDSGYGGVGPNFLPWLCAVVLAVCGAWLVWEARTGGYREASAPGGHPRADIGAFVWVSTGLLVNAALIGTVDRKSTRLNSSHSQISYAVLCLKTTNIKRPIYRPASLTTCR